MFRINFKEISFDYSKNRLLVGDFATCPQPFGLSPGAAMAAPSPRGLSPAPGAAPSPRFSGCWGWGLPQPPSPRGRGAAPGGWGQPPGAGDSPRGWGQPPGLGAAPGGWGQPRLVAAPEDSPSGWGGGRWQNHPRVDGFWNNEQKSL